MHEFNFTAPISGIDIATETLSYHKSQSQI